MRSSTKISEAPAPKHRTSSPITFGPSVDHTDPDELYSHETSGVSGDEMSSPYLREAESG